MKPWCTYKTTHPSGLHYHGKGRTELVLSGRYTGSGVRYKLALTWPGYDQSTWTTSILETFDTEEEAYLAEERIVQHEHLADPMCLNMMAGGRKGKYKTQSSLLRRFRSELKKIHAAEKREVSRARIASLKLKAKEAKAKAAQKLREAKGAVKKRSAKAAR